MRNYMQKIRKSINKKSIAFIMVLFLFISNFSYVNAADTSIQLPPNCYEINGTYIYMFNDDSLNAIVVYDYQNNVISGSISFERGSVYEYSTISNPSTTRFLTNDDWNKCILFMKDNLSQARYIEGDIEEYDDVEITSTRSSVSADLLSDLRDRTGSEYTDTFIDSTTYSNYWMTIRESMVQRISKKRTFSWRSSITIASYCATFLSLSNPSSSVISAVATVFGITNLATSLIPAGKSNEYKCQAIYTKTTYVSRNNYACNSTSKYRTYYGLDDGDLSSSNRAKIYSPSPEYSYSHSGQYYSNHNAQYSDAYDYFLAYYI